MTAKLTHAQHWELHKLSQSCTYYGAVTLKILINQYLKQHALASPMGRKDHTRMVEYFNELLQLTINNQLSK